MTRRAPHGVYRGVVQRTDGAHVWVQVRRLAGLNVYGPAEQVVPGAPIASVGATEGLTAPADGHQHVVILRPLQAGDKVLVTFIEGRTDEIVVLGRLA